MLRRSERDAPVAKRAASTHWESATVVLAARNAARSVSATVRAREHSASELSASIARDSRDSSCTCLVASATCASASCARGSVCPLASRSEAAGCGFSAMPCACST